MSWMKFATVALGIASIVVGVVVPGAQAVLLPIGTGLVGLALKSPFDPSK